MLKPILISQNITLKTCDNLSRYFNEVSKFETLSPEKEVELANKALSGDEMAQDLLIKSNLKFVISVAKHFQGQGMSLNDLINEGNIGLITALHKFDPTKGFKFISYAVWYIRQAMMTALQSSGKLVKIPTNKVDSLIKISKLIDQLEKTLERAPTVYELTEALGKDAAKVLSLSYTSLYFDDPMSGDEENSVTLYDKIPSQSTESSNDLIKFNEKIIEKLQLLSNIERVVLKAYFGIGTNKVYTLEEIGEMYGKSSERVRQIKETAIRKLRNSENINELKEYLYNN